MEYWILKILHRERVHHNLTYDTPSLHFPGAETWVKSDGRSGLSGWIIWMDLIIR